MTIREVLINAATDTTLSQPFPLKSYNGMTLTAEWTGTIAGLLAVYMSSSYDPDKNPSGAFTDVSSMLSGLAAASPNGSAGNSFIDTSNFKGAWFKVGFTKTGGSGTVTVTVSAAQDSDE